MKSQDELYEEASAAYGAALQRLARGYEADFERRRDLVQQIHVELWRSLRLFDARCSLQTWVYRVAHNVAASHVLRSRRTSSRLVDIDALKSDRGFVDGEAQANQQYSVSRLLERIYRLKPLDRQIALLYLEGEHAASIAEITGLSAANVATKIHRIKRLLSRDSGEGAIHARR